MYLTHAMYSAKYPLPTCGTIFGKEQRKKPLPPEEPLPKSMKPELLAKRVARYEWMANKGALTVLQIRERTGLRYSLIRAQMLTLARTGHVEATTINGTAHFRWVAPSTPTRPKTKSSTRSTSRS